MLIFNINKVLIAFAKPNLYQNYKLKMTEIVVENC